MRKILFQKYAEEIIFHNKSYYEGTVLFYHADSVKIRSKRRSHRRMAGDFFF